MAGTAAGVRGRVSATLPITGTREDTAMSTHVDIRTPATTFLTHYFGGGLVDKGECYVVERFLAYVAQQIVLRLPWIRCCGAGEALPCAT